MNYLLVHSPFLGPSVWGPLRSLLMESGHDVAVADLRGAASDALDPYAALGRRVSERVKSDSIIVMHSGAGALAASICSTSQSVNRMVFLDALLPHPGRSWLETLPEGMASQLVAASIGDCLLPWPSWFPNDALEQLIRDSRLRLQVSSDAEGVPLSYVAAKAPACEGWERMCSAHYVQLSGGYAEEAQKAAILGFRLDRLDGNHLTIVSNPKPVADLLTSSV